MKRTAVPSGPKIIKPTIATDSKIIQFPDTDNNVKILPDFFVDKTTLLAMRYYPTNNGFGKISFMFFFSEKINPDQGLYAQLLFDLESEEEKEIMIHHPNNIANWDKEFVNKYFKPMMAGAKPGVNSFTTDMIFEKDNNILSKEEYYSFNCVYFNTNNSDFTKRKIKCNKGTWLQLSLFIYYNLVGYPAPVDIFLDNKFKKTKLIKVTGLLFNGSTHTLFFNNKVVMSHFTLYYQDGIETGEFGFNIPCEEPKQKKIERKPMDEKKFIELYSEYDTISPDRLFVISSPEKFSALLTGRKEEDFYRIYTLDPEIINRTNWTDWSKYIYI